jgi:hypothetical protein
LPVLQSASLLHTATHASAAASQANRPQAVVTMAGQLPLPAQLAGAVATPLTQAAARQLVWPPG